MLSDIPSPVSLDTTPFNGSAFILYCTLIKHFAVKDQDCYCHHWVTETENFVQKLGQTETMLINYHHLKKLYSTVFHKWSKTTLNRIHCKIIS